MIQCILQVMITQKNTRIIMKNSPERGRIDIKGQLQVLIIRMTLTMMCVPPVAHTIMRVMMMKETLMTRNTVMKNMDQRNQLNTQRVRNPLHLIIDILKEGKITRLTEIKMQKIGSSR